MTYDPHRHYRRSVRLKGYDYSRAGAYFVTIVTQDRSCLFGEVEATAVRLNDAGRMVQSVWDELSAFYPGVLVDEFVVMPNHVHGIIFLTGVASVSALVRASPRDAGSYPNEQPTADTDVWTTPGDSLGPADRISGVGRQPVQAPGSGQEWGPGQARGPAPTEPVISLADVVHRFKTMTTRRYAGAVKNAGWTPFRGRLWQRNYYEHIIRNDAALDRTRRYVVENPARWGADEENPNRVSV